MDPEGKMNEKDKRTPPTNENANNEEQEVTPWEVKGKIDYMQLVKQFGTELIDESLLEKFKRITGKELHPWIKRGIFFSHRGLHQFLDAYENGEPVFLYTGRGPTSDAMHVGHLIPFMFTKWLQDVFDCPLVIQIADEEKAAFKKVDFNIIYKMGFENAKEIISCGFNPDKTFIFSNRDYRQDCRKYENFVSEMKMRTASKELNRIFGLNEESTIGMYDWPFYQTAAAFYQAYPHIFGNRPAYCLIPHAIDQDPYFRLARDIASRMRLIKPCSIMCTFLPPLRGGSGKMSSSVSTDSTLFLNDDFKVLKKKINSSFSGAGGDGSLEYHKKYGGIPSLDISYQYLRYFEHDDKALQEIHDSFESGELSCGGIKEILFKKLKEIIENIHNNRAQINQEVLLNFYAMKKIELPKPKERKLEEPEAKLYELLKSLGIEYRTKYHAPLSTPDDEEEVASSVEGNVCRMNFIKGPKDAYYIYIAPSDKKLPDNKPLAKKMEVKSAKKAEKDTFNLIFQVPETVPSVFALMNVAEPSKVLTAFIDTDIPDEVPVNFRPLRPDATTTINYKDMLKLIEHFKIQIKFIQC